MNDLDDRLDVVTCRHCRAVVLVHGPGRLRHVTPVHHEWRRPPRRSLLDVLRGRR